MTSASKTYITRTIARLYGLIEGITIDYKLNDKEISNLYNWMETHTFLVECEPFRGLWKLLDDILEDQLIDHDEREELLEWCSEIINDRGFLDGFSPVLRTLHGILGGIVADEKITKDELMGLQDWLLDYEDLAGWWPINEITMMVKEILRDGKIDKVEHKLLTEYFNEFSERPLENVEIHDEEYLPGGIRHTNSLFFNPISNICEDKPVIEFPHNSFCFTGPAASGSRKDFFNTVNELGGNAHKSVVNGLDYLVIGAQSSPAWAYSTYGRKIESAMQKNKNNKLEFIHIVHEKDFVKAVIDAGGQDILPKSKGISFSQFTS